MTYNKDQNENDDDENLDNGDIYTTSSFIQKQRLHPAAMIFRLVADIKNMLFGLGVGFIVTIKESFLIFLIFGGGFLLLLLISSFLSWWKFTYEIKGDELRIEQGVFVRKKRYVSFHRIHKIDMTANVVHRLLKLTKLQIDTASSNEDGEVILSALKVSDALLLRDTIKGEQSMEAVESNLIDKEIIKQKMTWKSLFTAGTTSGSVGFILLAFLAIVPQLEELIPWSILSKTYQLFIGLGIFFIVIAVIIILLGLWLLGIAGMMIKYGNFTIEKRENELFIKRGLLETKELTIPFDRIQAIGVEQSLIRQPLRYAKVYAVVAGGSTDSRESFPILFPLLKKSEVQTFLQTFVPDHGRVEAEQCESSIDVDEQLAIEKASITNYLPKQSKKYYLFKQIPIPFIAFVICLYFIPSFSWIPLFIVFIGLAYGNLAYKDAMMNTNEKQLTIQMRRMFSKVTVTTYQRRIQSLKMSENPLQRRDHLSNIYISLIGSNGLGTHYEIRHLAREDVERLADWFSYRLL